MESNKSQPDSAVSPTISAGEAPLSFGAWHEGHFGLVPGDNQLCRRERQTWEACEAQFKERLKLANEKADKYYAKILLTSSDREKQLMEEVNSYHLRLTIAESGCEVVNEVLDETEAELAQAKEEIKLLEAKSTSSESVLRQELAQARTTGIEAQRALKQKLEEERERTLKLEMDLSETFENFADIEELKQELAQAKEESLKHFTDNCGLSPQDADECNKIIMAQDKELEQAKEKLRISELGNKLDGMPDWEAMYYAHHKALNECEQLLAQTKEELGHMIDEFSAVMGWNDHYIVKLDASEKLVAALEGKLRDVEAQRDVLHDAGDNLAETIKDLPKSAVTEPALKEWVHLFKAYDAWNTEVDKMAWAALEPIKKEEKEL